MPNQALAIYVRPEDVPVLHAALNRQWRQRSADHAKAVARGRWLHASKAWDELVVLHRLFRRAGIGTPPDVPPQPASYVDAARRAAHRVEESSLDR